EAHPCKLTGDIHDLVRLRAEAIQNGMVPGEGEAHCLCLERCQEIGPMLAYRCSVVGERSNILKAHRLLELVPAVVDLVAVGGLQTRQREIGDRVARQYR